MKKSLSLLIVTLIFATAGVYIRRLALLYGFDAQSLTIKSYSGHSVLVVLSAVMLCVLFGMIIAMRPSRQRVSAEDTMASGSVVMVLEIIAGAAIIVSGAVALLFETGGITLTFAAVMACFAILTGICLILFTVFMSNNRFGSAGVPILITAIFTAFWLVYVFKSHGNDPVLAGFAYEILGVASSALSCYFIAGLCVKVSKPWPAAFFSMAAVYFLALSLINADSLSSLLLYGGFILFLAVRTFSIIQRSSSAGKRAA